jgi:glucan 1,3-beta-glucosidase
MVPALYEKYLKSNPVAVDEWTLSENMRADTAGGGIQQLEDHYKTYIVSFYPLIHSAYLCRFVQTEKDFAEIAGAGLNYVRIPIGFWVIETREGEPFLAKTSWT